MFSNPVSPDQLKRLADDELTYFTGTTMNTQNQVRPYLGDGDDLLHFGGNMVDSTKSFATAYPNGEGLRQFGIRLTNASTTNARTCLLVAGYFSDIAALNDGLIASGAFNDKTGGAGLSGSAQTPGKTIEEFLEWLKYVPAQLVMMKIRSNNIDQISNPITVKTLSPFQDLPTEYIQPENAQDQYSNNEKVVTFFVEKQLDFSRVLEYTVEPSTTVTIVFFIGATLDTAVALERKRAKAKVTMSFIGEENIQELGKLQSARALGM
jgi:hypothetical protein